MRMGGSAEMAYYLRLEIISRRILQWQTQQQKMSKTGYETIEPPLIPAFRKGGVPKKAVLRDGGLANSHDA
jgi:hypothetical protein